jgi:hypothetical protein
MPSNKTRVSAAPTSGARELRIALVGLVAIFLDVKNSRAMIGFLNEPGHTGEFLVNGKPLRLNGLDFAQEEFDWTVKLRTHGRRVAPVTRDGSLDFLVNVSRLEGHNRCDAPGVAYDRLKGRFYVNTGRFAAAKISQYEVDFVRQDSRVPLTTWRPRAIAESVEIVVPLAGLERVTLESGGETQELGAAQSHVIELRNDCGAAFAGADTDFVKYYNLFSERIVPAVPVKVGNAREFETRSQGGVCPPGGFDGCRF